MSTGLRIRRTRLSIFSYKKLTNVNNSEILNDQFLTSLVLCQFHIFLDTEFLFVKTHVPHF